MVRLVAATAATLALMTGGCAVSAGDSAGAGGRPTASRTPEQRPTPTPSPSTSPTPTPPTPSTSPTPRPDAESRVLASDGKPREAQLSVPAIGLRDLPVIPYVGSPDDAPGTRIQDGGVAASPHGARGGTGAGGVGNYIVTAHRTSSTKAFADLPSLRVGEKVHVVAGGTRFTYRVVRTRWTSFRSGRSLAKQSAAVPGHPGRRPTRAMITLSTCATPEDHADGNYWSDEFGNPEHRIDKIGVLVDSSPATG